MSRVARRHRVPLFAVAALALASCASTPDVCAGVAGACLSLELTSSAQPSLAFEQLHAIAPAFALDQFSPSTANGTVHLPAIVALVPPATFSGSFSVELRLVARGDVVATGQANGQLAAGQHLAMTVALDVGAPSGDGGLPDMTIGACNGSCGNGCCDSASHQCVPAGAKCSNGQTCANQSCGSASCGVPGTSCCPGNVCNGCCVNGACIGTGSMCSIGGTCNGMNCGGSCGGDGQACCPGNVCVASGTSCFASSNTCKQCGSAAQVCCNGVECQSGLSCGGNGLCNSGGTGGFLAPMKLQLPSATTVQSHSAVAAADLNGDGTVDYAFTDDGNAHVIVVPMPTGFSYMPGSTYTVPAVQLTFNVGTNPIALAAGDLNGDGHDDLVAANQGSNSLSLMLSISTGGLMQPQTLTVTGMSGPSSVGLGNILGGAHPHIVTGTTGNQVCTFLAPGFAGSCQTLDAGVSPSSLAVGDFNNDGNADVVFGSTQQAAAFPYLANGSGGFVIPGPGGIGVGAASKMPGVALADLNGDTFLDIVGITSGPNFVGVDLNTKSSPSFTANPKTIPVASGGFPFAVAVADFNKDGRADVTVTDGMLSQLYVFLGDGTGNLTLNSTINPCNLPRSVVATDVNGDGKPDVVVACQDVPLGAVILNNF